MKKGTQERKITLEQLSHYTQLAKELVSGLTSADRIALLNTPLPALPNHVSVLYRAVYEILWAGCEENEKATIENKTIAKYFRSELQRQSTPPELNEDTLTVVAHHSDTQTLGRLTQTNRRAYLEFPSIFKNILSARELLIAVFDADLNGNATQLIESLKPEKGATVLERGYAVERCGRQWKKRISPLEAAAWIGDVMLMKALLEKVPRDKKSEALAQLIGVRNNGLEHGPHMAPFHTFVDVCRTYVSDFSKFKDWDARDDYCVKIIGGTEKLLPLFGLQWLCDNEPFDPVPKFNRAPLRALLLQGESLLDILTCLGLDFFIFKWAMPERWNRGMTRQGWFDERGARRIGGALERLCQVSLRGLNDLILQLQNEVSTTPGPSNSS